MDPENERLKPVDADDTSGAAETLTAAPAHWQRSGGRWLRSIAYHRVTAIDLLPATFQLTLGARFGGDFVPTESWCVALADDAGWTRLLQRVARRAVHVSVPEELVIRRMFHVPTRDEREIRTMLDYQLGPSLPIPLRDLSWSWHVLEHSDEGSRVLVELVRRDALDHHLAPLVDASVTIDRAIPEGWLLAHRVWELSGSAESSGLFLRGDGVILVAQRRGRFLHATRLLPDSLEAKAADGVQRREFQRRLEVALIRARDEFSFQFDRPLPDVAIVVAEPARSPRDHEAEVVISNALGAEPAGARVHEETIPWRGVALAALASEPGPSLVSTETLLRRRTRRLMLHAGALTLAVLAALGGFGWLQLERLRSERDELQRQLTAESGSQVDLSAMQDALRAAARRRAGSLEPLHVLLAVERHASNDFLLDKLTYLSGQRIQISGSAQDVSSVVRFAEKLEAEPIFASAAVQSLSEVVREEQVRTRFELEGRLAR